MVGRLITVHMGQSVIPRLIKNMVTAAVGAAQLTYRGIIYAGGLQGVGKACLVPCLSRGWMGSNLGSVL